MSNVIDAMLHDRSRRQPTFESIQDALRAFFQTHLNKSLELSHDLPDDQSVDLDTEIEGLNELVRRLRRALAQQRFSESDRADADEIVAALGGSVHCDDDPVRTACNGVLRAKIENARILAAMLSGRHDLTSPLDPLFTGMAPDDFPALPGDAPPARQETLGSVVRQYRTFKSRGTWVKKTAADHERVFALAFEIVGQDKPIAAVGPDDVRAMRDALASVPKNHMKAAATRSLTAREAIASSGASSTSLSLKTQDKYFSMFRSLLIWAADEGLIERVPGRGVKVASTGRINPIDRRLPYSTEQLRSLLSSDVHCGRATVERGGRFWVPLIALYSGMRMGEIIQLLVSDVRQEQGVWFFDVNATGGKSLKTASSRRRVPVHADLVAIGLLDFHAKAARRKRLFADIEQGADGYHSHNFSKWWTRYSYKAGFASPKTSFHSFRHSFKDALVASDASEYVAKALLGHSDRSAHASYGSGPSLSALKAAVDRVAYPIDLSHLRG